MRRFLNKLFLFLAIFLSCAILALYAAQISFKRAASFEIKENTSIVIVGHSHPECAYNDSLMENTQNFAISGEAYFYTYHKLKKLVTANPQINTVFIEFTNNQISESINEWIWTEKYLSYHYAMHNTYVDWEDKVFLLGNNPRAYFSNLPIVFKTNMKNGIKGNFNAIDNFGGFKALNGDLSDYEDKLQEENPVQEDFVVINDKVSKVQINYLREMVDFLTERQIKVCLIRSPEHESYQGLANEKLYQEVLKENFSEVTFLDLIDFPVTELDFRDPEHLNANGAAKLSTWLNGLLLTKGLPENSAKFHWNYTEMNKYINE